MISDFDPLAKDQIYKFKDTRICINFYAWFKKTFYFLSSLLSIEKKKDAAVYLFLATVGHLSLFPLLFTQAGNVNACQ